MNRFRRNVSDDRGVFAGLQALESRELLSATVNVSPQGALEVIGDGGNNNIAITVQQTPKGSLSQVVVDGVKLNLPPNLVTSVGVRAGGGRDNVKVTIIGDNSSTDVFGNVNPLWVYVDGEAGDDTISLKGIGTATTEWSGSFGLNGGDGKDKISFVSDTFVYANGGNGDDIVTALDGGLLWAPTHSLSGDGYQEVGNDVLTNLGETSVSFSGGAGNDTLIGSSAGEYFNGGPGINTINGGAGNDVFSFHDDGEDTISGGDGSDTLYMYSMLGSITFDGGEGWDAVGSAFKEPHSKSKFINTEYSWVFSFGGGDGGGKG